MPRTTTASRILPEEASFPGINDGINLGTRAVVSVVTGATPTVAVGIVASTSSFSAKALAALQYTASTVGVASVGYGSYKFWDWVDDRVNPKATASADAANQTVMVAILNKITENQDKTDERLDKLETGTTDKLNIQESLDSLGLNYAYIMELGGDYEDELRRVPTFSRQAKAGRIYGEAVKPSLWDSIRLSLPVDKAWNPEHNGTKATWIEETRTAMLEIPKACDAPTTHGNDTFAVVHLFPAEKWPTLAVPHQWVVP